jgi:prepilin-type N-terminal cleavage/methylation domain-containing protein
MKTINKKFGFTLVETLVAISILSLSILAGFTAVQNGLKSSLTAKNQVVAFYLVQEAMEYIKNRRDNNALDFINGGVSTWLTGLSSCANPSVCYIDVPTDTITACSGVNTTCPNLVIKNSNGLYGYNAAGVTTNFKRAISYQMVNADEITVTIWISWTQGITTKSFQVTQTLLNRLQ